MKNSFKFLSFILFLLLIWGFTFSLLKKDIKGQSPPFTCTMVIGYSQVGLSGTCPGGCISGYGEGWYVAPNFGHTFETIVNNSRWQLLWESGHGVDKWQDPNALGWTRWANKEFPYFDSACTTNSNTPDRILFSISAGYGSDEDAWRRNIKAAINTIVQKIPSARQIILQAVVGGPNHQTCACTAEMQNTIQDCDFGPNVRASWQHKHIDNAISAVVQEFQNGTYNPGVQIVAGYSPEVRTCSDYYDGIGHLTTAGAEAVGISIAQYYANQTSLPSPYPSGGLPSPTASPSTPSLGNGDANGDGQVNYNDITAILGVWLQNAIFPLDQYGDGIINSLDFSVVYSHLIHPSPATTPPPTTFTNFITRSGNRLYDGANPFRFISVNIFNLHVNPDPSWHRVDPYEMEDAFKTVKEMGGRVIRLYAASILKSEDPPGRLKHYNGPGQYEELLFQDYDKILELANRYGIRLVFPFVDRYNQYSGGGIASFADFRGLPEADFYTNPVLRQDFKNFVSFILNRTNTYTGVRYRDDRAIMAWQLGNELDWGNDARIDAWISEMSAYVKSIDSNHLVMYPGVNATPSDAVVNDPNVDIIDMHYTNLREYPNKPFTLGEFHPDQLLNDTLLQDVVNRPGVAGAMVWTLLYHNKDGGFYYHRDFNMPSFRYPGFTTGMPGEAGRLTRLRRFAYTIQGLNVPPISTPDPPFLLPISSVTSISWRGSAGAATYDIERATNQAGPWTRVATDVSDAQTPAFVPFNDTSAVPGQIYYYRVRAKNNAGISDPSNTVPSG